MNIEIANRFQQLRKKNNLSQEELAEKIGVSRQAVSKWERAEASPDTDNLILLSKLYGISLDELLKTDSVQIGSSGVSLKKEDYGFSDESVKEMRPDNYTDEEIYPGRNGGEKSSSQQKASAKAENPDTVREKLSAAGLAVGDVINAVGNDRENLNEKVKTAGHAIGDAVSAAGNAAKKEIKKQKARKSFEDRYENVMDKFESGIENGMDKLGRGIEKGMEKLSDSMERFEESVSDAEAHGGIAHSVGISARTAGSKGLSLLDKTFPILIIFTFFLLVGAGAAHPGWTVFLLIPLYYTFKEAVRKKNPMIFCYPVLCVFVYCFIGGLFDMLKPRWSDEWYGFMWLIFLTIPLYYTGYTAIKKRNPLIFCYPVLCVLVYLGIGIFTGYLAPHIGEFWFAAAWLPILATIPFYYIAISHYRQKRKA